jgi:hypothetical protein
MEKIMEIVNWISQNYLVIANALLTVFGGLAVIVKLTPTLKDDNAIKFVLKFLGKITNKQDV